MRYLYSKYDYNEQVVFDVYVNVKGSKVSKNKKALNLGQILHLAAQRLLDSSNFVKPLTPDLPTKEGLLFTGGNLNFIRRPQNMSRKEAFRRLLFYDNN